MNQGEQDTREHIKLVQDAMGQMLGHLLNRAILHDTSKLETPELEAFNALANMGPMPVYDTPEYHERLRILGPALEHHYLANDHHPEHHEGGLNDMSLLSIIELFADWYAAGKRYPNGNLTDSITKNAERFNMDPQLVAIFRNTQKELGW